MMIDRRLRSLVRALATIVGPWTILATNLANFVDAQYPAASAPTGPYAALANATGAPYPATSMPDVKPGWPATTVQSTSGVNDPNVLPTSASWIVPDDNYQAQPYVDADVYCDPPYGAPNSNFGGAADGFWCWQVLPDGLIYRSYMAGVHEPRIGLNWFSESDGRNLWDATLGGRAALLRYGTTDPLHPQGWELDIEGAAIVRLNLENNMDLDDVDFRFGVPLTYGIDNWQFKFAYYHLSSHMGDEFAIRTPGALATRINYVRDSLVLGASYYVVPSLRLYSEIAYATNADGGAEPLELQFGTEWSKPGPTGFAGSPFLALNGHLRQEHDFGGDFTAQAGWLWRGNSGHMMRIGAHYFNGKSSQWQTFDDSEEQIGAGIWYDF
jgi:Protein of unknown function (DUF1207)